MRRFLWIALLVVGVTAMVVAQTSMTQEMQNAPARKSPLSGYAGSWIGSFDGKAWITIRLSQQGTAMTGTVVRPQSVNFTDQGELKSISDEQVTDVVQTAVVNGDGLLLTTKDSGSQETFRYQLRLTGEQTAEVKMVAMSMPPGMPKPKPWKLSRVGPNAVTPVR